MPLYMSLLNEEKEILKINGKDNVKRHLGNLGLVVGNSVTVISKLNGNIILKVNDTKIALDKSLANRIIVKG